MTSNYAQAGPAVSWQLLPTLCADRPTSMTASAGLVELVTDADRQLSGLVLPFGEIGHTNIGPVPVSPSCVLDFPAQLGDVKLVDEHQHPPRPIGYMTAQRRVDGIGYRAAFHVGATADGDRALQLAAERLREGFSVELDNLEFDAAGQLTRATVVRVAHVTTPAYASARHDGMAASRNTTREDTTTMLTEAQRARLLELLAIAADDRTDDERTELSQLATIAGVQLLVSGDEPGDESDDESGDESDDESDDDEQPQTGSQLAASRRRARVPQLHSAARRGPRHTLREFYAAQARVLSGHSRPAMEAALQPITNTANIWTAADEYAGQLWDQVEYQRRYVANSLPGELNSYKGVGWRWDVRPEVADYAGDKTDVPSNSPTTEDAEWTAARLAGAHDIDRKFWDFGDTEFIEAYFAAMRESYARKSDAKALAFQLASATALGAAGATMFTAAATAAASVEDVTGQAVDFIYVNSTDRLGLLGMTQDDVPPFLEVFGITPAKFIPAAGVAAGTVVAGVRSATKFRELSQTPIRVEAINLAKGGIDGGVFGYYATEQLQVGGIASATFAAA